MRFQEMISHNPSMAASIKSSSSASGSNIQRKFSGHKRATDDESSSSPSKRQKSSSAFASGSNIWWKFDVFLSFRGEDTRNSFTDHLYAALKQKGIYTFRDDEGLERGKEISSELLEAIEESRFSIVILSENYASSTWCLDELSKIVECMDSQKHTVFPIFYKVNPSDVRKQKGDFKKAFDKHEHDFKDNPEMVEKWRSSLKRVGKIAGWDLKDRSEANLIEGIVGEISRTLINLRPSVVGDQLVGIESRVKEIDKLLEHELDDRVTFVGICGMGGIGKTTIARVVYERLSNKYEGSCFLANVREIFSEKRGVVHLQQMLLSKILHANNLNICDSYDGISLMRSRLCEKKVFLVLDDVDQLEQLEQLAGRNDWFGSGSRIIITTRDERVLVSHGINNLYRVQGFDYDDAKSLFHLKAFKNIRQTKDYVGLSRDVVRYANGLPLALKVLGSFLCDRSVNEWKSALERLREVPDKKIMKILRISYDGLGKKEMEIFLDIACFFKGWDKDQTMEILNVCDFHPVIGLEVLVERSLITIVDKKLHMHDLVQEMGWEVVRQQHPKEPSKWSRLWVYKNVYQVLAENMETPSVEGIILNIDRQREEIPYLKLNGKSFSGMSNLRLLIINNIDVYLFEDLEYLSNELRLLEWHGYPLKSLPSSFQPQKLVRLGLCYSHIQYIWKDIKHSMKYLKTINLSFSHYLIKTPDFEMIPNLERLYLQCCTKLREVHKSVGSLGKLIVLNLNGCSNLVVFPRDVRGLKSLKILNLNGCSKLNTLHLNLEEVELLEKLDISGTAIYQIVISSIVQLKNLETLLLRGCKVGPPKTWSFFLWPWLMLSKRKFGSMSLMLPTLTGLSSLTKLDLRHCNLLEIPSDIGSLFSLRILDIHGNNFVSLPDSIGQLSRLKGLSLEKCRRLQSLPKLPPKIEFVWANDCTSLKTISSVLELTSKYVRLLFFNCFELFETQGMNDSLAIMLLKRWFQINEISNQEFAPESHLIVPGFHILLPGSEISELFSYCSEGSTIKWPPSHCLLNDELIGFCVCAVVSNPYRLYNVQIICTIRSFRWKFYPNSTFKGVDHLWLAYFPKDTFNPDDGIYTCEEGVTVGFAICDYKSKKEYNNMVKRCGIRPVYKQDVEYLKELSATNGGITMPSRLQGSRFRCIHCIEKEINADFSEDISVEEGDYSEDISVEEGNTGTAADDIGNSINIADQSEDVYMTLEETLQAAPP